MNLKRIFWNPIAFFISFFMSLIMPLFFATSHMPLDVCIYYWPARWVVAYFLVALIIQPLSMKLSQRYFNFPPMP